MDDKHLISKFEIILHNIFNFSMQSLMLLGFICKLSFQKYSSLKHNLNFLGVLYISFWLHSGSYRNQNIAILELPQHFFNIYLYIKLYSLAKPLERPKPLFDSRCPKQLKFLSGLIFQKYTFVIVKRIPFKIGILKIICFEKSD